MSWTEICPLNDIPKLGSRVVRTSKSEIGVFRTDDDRVFAINNLCPHKKGPLSQGIVFGDTVQCPLHNWKISLVDGKAEEPDEGETTCYQVKVEDGIVFLEV
ncbi:MAG: nitrite reductase (NAD(P)H) small subunit [Methylophilaceae bacterium]|nr:MAG: nitrite reductase (NAD(P)H) small subunit [Methylophilaceae bacterium]